MPRMTRPKSNAYAEQAKKLLVHYFQMAGIKTHLNPNLKSEIEDIVDLIIMGARTDADA